MHQIPGSVKYLINASLALHDTYEKASCNMSSNSSSWELDIEFLYHFAYVPLRLEIEFSLFAMTEKSPKPKAGRKKFFRSKNMIITILVPIIDSKRFLTY